MAAKLSNTKPAVLLRRAEFLAVAASGKKWVAPGMIVQWAVQPKSVEPSVRYGLTASSKVGNAVVRNRARRRLRSLALDVLAKHAKAGHDYVLIARAGSNGRDFDDLKRDLITSLKRLGAWQE